MEEINSHSFSLLVNDLSFRFDITEFMNGINQMIRRTIIGPIVLLEHDIE